GTRTFIHMLRSYEYVNLADIIAIAPKDAARRQHFSRTIRCLRAACAAWPAVANIDSERSCDFMSEKTRASSPGSD
ncbi:hypothetical protein, partial [Paraburkholderia tropica]|uniref:hypothetical protein n=1 Tax=Paraburkholderia tropica TaxID=92647 RepID=UPI002AAF604C